MEKKILTHFLNVAFSTGSFQILNTDFCKRILYLLKKKKNLLLLLFFKITFLRFKYYTDTSE